MPIDAPFTEITAVAPDIADILLSGTWKIAAAVYDKPALMLTFFNCKISFFNNVADSATVLSPTVNFIETPFDDVLAVICELPLFFISNSSATTLHPLFAGTEIEYSSVGYLSPD